MVATDGMGQVEQRLVVSFAEVKNKTGSENAVARIPANFRDRVGEVRMRFTFFLSFTKCYLTLYRCLHEPERALRNQKFKSGYQMIRGFSYYKIKYCYSIIMLKLCPSNMHIKASFEVRQAHIFCNLCSSGASALARQRSSIAKEIW